MPETSKRSGGISVETAHIFPVIKKWLYSEKDIFLREIVSNAADAVTKHKRLVSIGEAPDDETDYKITVTVDKEAKTLSVTDNGIGMNREELLKYLGSIALSGALDFIQKYEGSDKEGQTTGIIGHFGLGFYSAFMVADDVEVLTRSYDGSDALRWVCHADGSYELYDREQDGHGTTVIMHITDDESTYLEKYKVSDLLEKYCSFMPTDIYLEDAADEKADADKEDEADADTQDADTETDADAGTDTEEKPAENKKPKPVNDKFPLWQKNPSECTPEEYKEFYRKVFRDYREPLFWIHINADYPLNFKGILYFPRLSNEYESLEGQVKLYYNQVFVADNIKEVIPEYLLMLKGVLDCPELPLNVSRSYLQNNTYVSKVSAHIVKKVTDKLTAMCSNEREEYEKVWDSIKTFVEYACMRDRKFYDRSADALLLHLTKGGYVTVSEYLEHAGEKHENVVYYTTDKALQAQYIELFENQDIEVAVLDKLIDTQYIQTVENYASDVRYQRIDADVAAALKGDGVGVDNTALTDLYRKVSGNDKLEVKFECLKDTSLPAMLMASEQSRRMQEMMKLYSMQSGDDADASAMFPLEYTLLVNTACPLTDKLSGLCDTDAQKAELIAGQIYGLSVLAQRRFSADELKKFLKDSFSVLDTL